MASSGQNDRRSRGITDHDGDQGSTGRGRLGARAPDPGGIVRKPGPTATRTPKSPIDVKPLRKVTDAERKETGGRHHLARRTPNVLPAARDRGSVNGRQRRGPTAGVLKPGRCAQGENGKNAPDRAAPSGTGTHRTDVSCVNAQKLFADPGKMCPDRNAKSLILGSCADNDTG